MLEDNSEYDSDDKEREQIRKDNGALIGAFRTWLIASGRSKATVNKHHLNIDFFLNHYLLYDDLYTPEEGIAEVDNFMGYWFLRKAMWASETSLKSNATSLRQFYTFMLEEKRIKQEDFETLKRMIKDGMPEWLETLRRYDDPDIDYDDVF